MKGSSTFQVVIMIVMIIGIVFAVAVFSGFIKFGSSSSTAVTGSVSVWGELPRQIVAEYFTTLNTQNQDLKISYTELPSENFDQAVLEALASGKGPDVVLITDDMLLKYKDKAFMIPFTSYSEGQIKTNFIREAELLITKDGLMGFPVTVDPLVLYYNRDLFDKAGIAVPPKNWDEIKNLVPLLTTVDKGNFTIKQSALPFGDFDNIAHAKEIITALLLQTGNPLYKKDISDYFIPTFKQVYDQKHTSMNVLDFYTSFASPTSELYTWNRGLPNSEQQFLVGKSAMYIGYASELFALQQKNPNFNFDVVPFPQIADATSAVTYGKMLSAVVIKSTQNVAAAYYTAALLSGVDAQKYLSEKLSVPPVRRDLLAIRPSQTYAQVFYNGALTARSWIDPNTVVTSKIIRDMIAAINSGSDSSEAALSNVDAALQQLFMAASATSSQ